MIDKLSTWAKSLELRGNFWGTIFKLLYEICVNSGFQSAVHVVAACVLGAFAFKDGSISLSFVIPFALIYVTIIVIFFICNEYRKIRNNSLKVYEISYTHIAKTLLSEYRNELDLYNKITPISNQEVVKVLSEHDFFTDACFRICDAINTLLVEICGKNSFRITVYLRTLNNRDEYSIRGFSPLDRVPESYGEKFDLNKYSGGNIRKKDIPVHARPFLNKRFEPIILVGNEVKKAYADFNLDHPTKLHIGIPCEINGMVAIVLQITSYDHECLGNRSNINDLVQNLLSIFTSYLKVVYMQQMKHEFISTCTSKLCVEV